MNIVFYRTIWLIGKIWSHATVIRRSPILTLSWPLIIPWQVLLSRINQPRARLFDVVDGAPLQVSTRVVCLRSTLSLLWDYLCVYTSKYVIDEQLFHRVVMANNDISMLCAVALKRKREDTGIWLQAVELAAKAVAVLGALPWKRRACWRGRGGDGAVAAMAQEHAQAGSGAEGVTLRGRVFSVLTSSQQR